MDLFSSATVDLVKMSLAAAELRHEAIASNIANWSTGAYKPVKVEFESYLKGIKADLEHGKIADDELQARMAGIRPVAVEHSLAAGETVNLDAEMVDLTQNVIRYQTLLTALSKRGSLNSMAISGGR